MFRTMRVLGFAVALVVCSPSRLQAADDPEAQALAPRTVMRIEDLVAEKMSREAVPSVSIAIALNNDVVWANAYGVADIENHVPATARTLYRTASIDKWMTATATMTLIEEGTLSLDAEASRYCEVFPRKRWPVRVRNLLNHTSGVRHYWGREQPGKRAREWSGFLVRHTDRTTPVDTFNDDPLLFEPGTRFRYTSHGYRLLGCVLVGASGETYSSLMGRRIFKPAQMEQTTPDDSWAIIPHRAAGYSATGDGRLRRASFRDVSENLPAGGHLSTPTELVKFAVAFNTGRLVRPESIERMLARPSLEDDNDADYYGYGINVMLPEAPRNTTGETVLHHGGSQNGTETVLALVPARGIALSIMMNHDATDWDDLGWPILGMLTEQ